MMFKLYQCKLWPISYFFACSLFSLKTFTEKSYNENISISCYSSNISYIHNHRDLGDSFENRVPDSCKKKLCCQGQAGEIIRQIVIVRVRAEVIFRDEWIVLVGRWCFTSGPLEVIGQFSCDGIGSGKARAKFVSSHCSVLESFDSSIASQMRSVK